MAPPEQYRDLSKGAAFGRYVILDRVGAGAAGSVYAAYDPRLDRRVALKLLHRGDAADPGEQARLIREAQVMARLSHPNVAAVYDAGEVDGDAYLAMEFIEGPTLRAWLAEEGRSASEVLDVLVPCARALAAAHAAGIVHRDFKPENVLLDASARPHVVDFGLARSHGLAPAGERPDASLGPESELASRLTGAVGTPAYMAPEQLRLGKADARADQFAFGVVAWEALHRERPFAGESLAAAAFAAAEGRVRPAPAGARVPARVRRVLLRAIDLDPAARYPSMDALAAALERGRAGAVGRRWLAVAAVVVVAAGAAGYGGLRARTERLCAGGPQELAGYWDTARRGEVTAALRATAFPFAEAAAKGVAERLDAWAADWTAQYAGACEATRLRGVQSEATLDLRMRCLDRRRLELRSLVDLFVHPDAKLVERAVSAAHALRRPQACADVEALAAVVEPADERVRAEALTVARHLARAQALLDSGKWPDALAAAREATSEAVRVGHAPLLAEALLLRGDGEGRTGDLAAAERTLREALATAERGRHDEVRARALFLLAFNVGFRQGRAGEGRQAAAQGFAVVDRLGSGRDELRADVESALAAVERGAAAYPEALRHDLAALALRERALGPDHPRVGTTESNVSGVLLQLSRLEEALQHAERAVQIFEARLGKDHPDLGAAKGNVGAALFRLGRYRAAADAMARSLALKEAALGPTSSGLIHSLNNLAQTWVKIGKVAEAQGLLDRAFQIQRATGAETLPVAYAHYGLARTRLAAGDMRAARAAFERAAALARKLGGPDHDLVAEARVGLAECALQQGDARAALGHARAALAIDEKVFGAESSSLSGDLTWVGEALLALGQPAQAVTALERGVSLAIEGAVDPLTRAGARFALARALRAARGDQARALELARAAHAEFSVAEGGGAKHAEVERWLAEGSR